MAYGRLDVLFPDGNFRSFPLVNQTESVGRSPGNTIKLEAETISRYHISISKHPDNIELADMDSQNGTYVDGVKLPNGEKIELRGGEEILIGELRMIFHVMEEMPTQPMSMAEDTAEVLRDGSVPFHISLQPPPISIPPGAHASAELTIANLTDEQSYYTVTVSGVPRSWVRLDRPKVLLEPHESGQVVINIRPARQSDTAPGDYTITVNVRIEGEGEYKTEATTRIHILPYGGFGMALEDELIDAREPFRLHLHNQGSTDLPLSIEAGSLTPGVKLEFGAPPKITLGPGERKVIQGRVKPSGGGLITSGGIFPFDIVIRSEQANQFMAVVRGKVTQRSVMASVTPYIAGVAVLIFLIFGFVIFSLLTAPTPTVTNFSVEPLSVARGEPLTLSWNAQDVRSLTLFVDETPVAQLTPEAGASTLDTTFMSDNAVVAILGETGRRTSEEIQQRIQIYEPMRSTLFEVTPPLLVQDVVEALSVRWDVANADLVRISGLDPFAINDIDPSIQYDPADSLEGIPGIATSNLIIELYAEDPLGNPFTDTVTVESIPAQCTPLEPGVVLRDGPNPLNQQISTVQEVEALQVVGQDSSGQWLAVALGGDLIGWGALAEFQCANTFNPANLRQIINVIPPPTPTLPPTVTPFPSPTATTSPVPTVGPIVTQQSREAGQQRSDPDPSTGS